MAQYLGVHCARFEKTGGGIVLGQQCDVGFGVKGNYCVGFIDCFGDGCRYYGVSGDVGGKNSGREA